MTPISNKRTQSDAASHALLLSVDKVAALLDCSTRHVYRLEERGQIPSAVRLGPSVRWPRKTIEEWIDAGCQPSLAV